MKANMQNRLVKGVSAAFAAVAMAPVAATTLAFPLAGGIAVSITETTFDRTQFAMADCSDDAARCRINGQRAFGTIGVPKSILSDIAIVVGQARYQFDVSQMFNPLLSATGGRPTEVFNGFCYDDRTCLFRAVFGDAGGIYSAEWQIVDGRVERTVLSDSGDLFQFFRKHLVPPRYY